MSSIETRDFLDSEELQKIESVCNLTKSEIREKTLEIIKKDNKVEIAFNRANLFGIKGIKELFLIKNFDEIIFDFEYLNPEFELKRDFMPEKQIKKIGKYTISFFSDIELDTVFEMNQILDGEKGEDFILSCQLQYGKIDKGFFKRIARLALRGDL